MLNQIAVWCALLSFALGTAAIEISTVLVVIVAVWQCRKIPSIPEGLLIYGIMAAAAIRAPQDIVEGLGKWWLFAPLIFLPPLLKTLSSEKRRQMLFYGALAMGGLALVGCIQAFQGSVAKGWYSHHLSFAYMLLMPLAYCLHHRHWSVALIIGCGVFATQAQGPMYSMLALVISLWVRPKYVLIVGCVGIFGIFLVLSEQPYFQERLAIWGSALDLLQMYPMGTGVSHFREWYTLAQSRFDPPFYFPHHAHDSAIQQALWFGVPIWLAWAVLLRSWWTWATWGQAMLVAIILGSFTEDTFGDMEILRILLVFGCFAACEAEAACDSSASDAQK